MTQPRKPIKTPSSAALEAVVKSYTSFNDELEKSLDQTEDRIPTRTKVRALLQKIDASVRAKSA